MHKSRDFFGVVVLLLAALVAFAACAPAKPAFKGTDISGVEWGGDFTLTAHTGSRVKVSDFKGRVLILFFGYTHCPDICAPTLARLASLMQQLGPEAERVQVLFVTVDPKHDTIEQLAGFVPKFHPAFIGLTGTAQEIGRVARDYKVAYAENPGSASSQILVDHSGGMLVKDATGKLRLLFRNDTSVDDMAHDVRRLLKGG
ncbi:MAG: SCO family protein [Gammaproteobacteria bacterium]|nr:SCO family protein [Gammaproteobacteria bacterium]